MSTINIDHFMHGYLECGLWSSTDDDESPLDDHYDVDDIHPDTVAELRKEVIDFIEANEADLIATGAADESNGHDFWLTRNGHGAGFWDRGYGEVGERLSEAARVYGSVNLYSFEGKVLSL